MDVFGLDFVYFVGASIIVLGTAVIVFIALGALAVMLFLRTRRVFIPTATLMIIDFFETPIKQILWILGVEGAFIDNMITYLRNSLYRKAYSKTPYETRAIFLPQCLRNPDCPAKLTGEGITCIKCGRCGIGELKELSEGLGCLFFVVPGSSFVKRMIGKYKPKAVLGIGCVMEVKEGTALVSSIGVPVQSVTLSRDGCIDTRIDVMKLIERIVLRDGQEFTMEHKKLADRISLRWGADTPSSGGEKNKAREMFMEVEEELLKVKRKLW